VLTVNAGGMRRTPLRLDDVLPEEPAPPQSWQAQLALVESMNAALGGEDRRARVAE